jgi:two-component system OmpR family response regulator
MEQLKKQHILLVEDDTSLGYLLMENLQAKDFEVKLVVDGKEAIDYIRREPKMDLCILDVMLPEQDGFSVASYLRAQRPEVPFLFLTARNQELDRFHGFELGAEDYLAKPFSFKELYYRIQVIMRRRIAAVQSLGVVSIGELSLDPNLRMLRIGEVERKLSQRESELLYLLLKHQGKYLPRQDILKQLWGRDDDFTAKSMDVFLTRLRKLVRDVPGLEIENLYGVGYRVKVVDSLIR